MKITAVCLVTVVLFVGIANSQWYTGLNDNLGKLSRQFQRELRERGYPRTEIPLVTSCYSDPNCSCAPVVADGCPTEFPKICGETKSCCFDLNSDDPKCPIGVMPCCRD